MRRALLLVPLALAAAACERPHDDDGVSSSEAAQLNDAAAMLDANSVSAETVDVAGSDDSQGNTQ